MIFLSMFISFLYTFRATMCPSSGETTVFMRHLALVMDYCLVCRSICSCIPDSHPYNVTGQELVSSCPVTSTTGCSYGFTNARCCGAPDDGWRYHLKHVEWYTDINKLYIVASCWTTISIYFTMHRPLNVKFIKC